MRARKIPALRKVRSLQGGVMLLEALIGLLIFSLGVLALVAMQSVSVSNVSNAKYRVEAALLADELLNKIWMERGVALQNVGDFAYPGGNSQTLGAWINKVKDPANGLPGAQSLGMLVEVKPAGDVSNPGREVTVTLNWKAPDALVPSRFVAIGYISDPS